MRTRVGSLVLAGIVLSAGLLWSFNGQRLPEQAGKPVTESASPSRAPFPRSTPGPSRSPSFAPSPPSSPPPAAPSRAEPSLEHAALRAALEELLEETATGDGAILGVAVLDASGTTVADTRGTEPLLPASTQKLVTAAGALVQLGGGHRFTTSVRAGGPVSSEGILEGDLILVGGGDPVLASPVFAADIEPGRPHTPLAELAEQVAAAGVRRIRGRVLGDASLFSGEPIPDGWNPEYLSSFNGVRTTALTVDAGRRLAIRDGRVVADPAEDPARQAAAQLQILLTERGVTVDDAAGTGSAADRMDELGRVDSPPLRDLLASMVQTSDNQIADSVFRSIGAAGGQPTWEGSAAATRRALAPLRLDWSGMVLADGSGLSRRDRLSANLLAELDQGMSRSELADEWEGLMAVSGRSGTLRRRLVGTVAEGRLRGKTGSLRDVRSIAGAVLGPDSSRYSFAVVGNGLQGEDLTVVRDLQDAIVLLLAEDLYGCVSVEVPASPPADPAEPSPPPSIELQCAA